MFKIFKKWKTALFILAFTSFIPSYASIPKVSDENLPSVGSSEEIYQATELLKREGIAIPAKVNLLAGDSQTIFWRNVIPVFDPGLFRYEVNCTCEFFEIIGRGIRLTPNKEASGMHQMNIIVLNDNGLKVAASNFEILVWEADSNIKDNKYSILFVGDSLGHQSRFPNKVAAKLNSLVDASINYIGTHKPAGAEIPHEQYGGWTFNRFLTGFNFDPKIFHTKQSPFVFASKLQKGKPEFDVSRYFLERVGGEIPDIIHIQLGINDSFLLNPENIEEMDTGIEKIMRDADLLIAGLRKGAPDAVISLGTVIPGNGLDRAYIKSYPQYPHLHSEWRWRQVQNRIARSMSKYYANQEKDKIYILPTHLFLDTLDGYYPLPFIAKKTDYFLSNAVHPNEYGDKQVAAPIYTHIYKIIIGELP